MESEKKGITLWFTGLSGAGKSTLATRIKQIFKEKCYILDGDIIRTGLNKDLGFSREDRKENIRRIFEVAKLFNQAGIIVIVAFISPYENDRQSARDSHLEAGLHFREVYIKASIECCESRDVKGLYKKARNGEIKNFTGISDAYEVPLNPDLVLDTENEDIEKCQEKLINLIQSINSKEERFSLTTYHEDFLILDEEELNLLQIIQQGWCPRDLKCFMNEEELLECLFFKTFQKNHFQPIPLILPITTEDKFKVEFLASSGKPLILINRFTNQAVAKINNPKCYNFRKEEILCKLYGTFSHSHPKIKKYLQQGDYLLTGDSISFLQEVVFKDDLDSLRLSPEKIRNLYKNKGGDCLFAFQVRNPLHNGHCKLLQEARKQLISQGFTNPILLLHPCGGWTKDDDLPLNIRINQYRALLEEKVLLDEETILAIWPSPMYFAGPLEVLWHFSSRENADVDFMIVGRDPAGIKHPERQDLDLYDPLHGQRIIDIARSKSLLKMKVIPFTPVCYNVIIKQMEFFKTENKKYYLTISGTEMRKLAREGKSPPEGFMNEKGWEILYRFYNSEIK
jgi:3'-phosphoadenosine 5'-phosphosulfate synthase